MQPGSYVARCVTVCVEKRKHQGDASCYFHLCLYVNMVYIGPIN
jgi:hypothetical protein